MNPYMPKQPFSFFRAGLCFFLCLVFATPLSAQQGATHHPIFQRFPSITPPAFGEEYFEWIDLLEAIDQAEGTFTMAELGAGEGRWGANGIVAARSRNIPFHITFVEAEPRRAQVIIHEEMAKLNVNPSQYHVIEAALALTTDYTFFYLAHDNNHWDLTSWFGQCVISPADSIAYWTNQEHYGHPTIKTNFGYMAVAVNQVLLSSVLNEIKSPIIDLCDFDIQGAEFIVIQEAIDILNARVKRMHIGTHSNLIEKQLRQFLAKNGWKLVRDYPFAQENNTEYGRLTFVDGVQTWINKRFLSSKS